MTRRLSFLLATLLAVPVAVLAQGSAPAPFTYTGTYTQQGNTLNARVHVKRFAAGNPNVMGRDEFDLELTGTKQGNAITATGVIPGTQLRLNGTLTKQG